MTILCDLFFCFYLTTAIGADNSIGTVNEDIVPDEVAICDNSGLYVLGEIPTDGSITEVCAFGKNNPDVFQSLNLTNNQMFGRIYIMITRNNSIAQRFVVRHSNEASTTETCKSVDVEVLESDLVLVFIQNFCYLATAQYACPWQVNINSTGSTVMYYNDSNTVFNISDIDTDNPVRSRIIESEILQNSLRQPVQLTDVHLNVEITCRDETSMLPSFSI